MTVTVPASDFVNNALQAEITALGTLITANPSALGLTLAQQQLQAQLVQNLLANAMSGGGGSGGGAQPSHLTPAGILSACTINT